MNPRTIHSITCLALLSWGGCKKSQDACLAEGTAATSYAATYTKKAPTIDGEVDPVWSAAKDMPSFQHTEKGQCAKQKTAGKLLWDDTYLYGLLTMTDSDIHSPVTQHDGPLWRHDVVELFIDHDGSRGGYAELQINPNNAQLDYWFATTRARPPVKTWNAKMESAVAVVGTKDKQGDTDKYWIAEFRVPLAGLAGPGRKATVSSNWRFNVVRIDTQRGEPMRVHSLFAIPISDFHAIDRLGPLTFDR